MQLYRQITTSAIDALPHGRDAFEQRTQYRRLDATCNQTRQAEHTAELAELSASCGAGSLGFLEYAGLLEREMESRLLAFALKGWFVFHLFCMP